MAKSVLISRPLPRRGRGIQAAIRPLEVGGSTPPDPLARSSTAERAPYKGLTRGSTPPAPKPVFNMNGSAPKGLEWPEKRTME
jgi:hypothetical protein